VIEARRGSGEESAPAEGKQESSIAERIGWAQISRRTLMRMTPPVRNEGEESGKLVTRSRSTDPAKFLYTHRRATFVCGSLPIPQAGREQGPSGVLALVVTEQMVYTGRARLV